MAKDYYEILHIKKSASDEEIKKAYRKLALKYHPDKNMGTSGTQKEAGEQFKLVNAAFQVLGNPEARRVYDEYGEEGLKGLAANSKKVEKGSQDQKIAKTNDSGATPPADVNFKFETASEETLFEERGEQDGVPFIRTGGMIRTKSRFTCTYTGEEDPMETFAKFFGTTDIFSLLVNVKDDEEGGATNRITDADSPPDSKPPPPPSVGVTMTSNLKPKLCTNCHLPIKSGNTIVFEDQPFHDGCFKCEHCFGEINSSIFRVDGKRYCENCHTDLFAKICVSCKKPVKGDCTIFREKPYHKDCLNCEQCKKPFAGTVMVAEDKLYCKECYAKDFASVCVICKGSNSTVEDTDWINFNGKKYHKACFVCKKCKFGQPKVNPVYTVETNKDDQYCSECYDSLFAGKCVSCKKVISVADEDGSVGSGDNEWHKKCFNCKDCGKSLLGTKVSIVGDKVACGTKCSA